MSSSAFYCPHCGLKLGVVFGSEVRCSRGHRWLLVKNGSTTLCELKDSDDYKLIERIKHKILYVAQDVDDCREGKG